MQAGYPNARMLLRAPDSERLRAGKDPPVNLVYPAILDFKTVTLCESEDTALRRDGGKDRST